MRVTGGNLRGRKLRVPRAAVRPTQDRVREALFSALQTVVSGARVLDLFAGSGAIGLGAWSRGAGSVCWVESNRRVYRVLTDNVADLCGSVTQTPAARTVCADVFAYLRKIDRSQTYDIVFADPPYRKARRGEDPGLAARVLQAVMDAGVLAPGGIMVLEQGSHEPAPGAPSWTLIRDKRYGGSRLRFYKAMGE